MASHKSTRRPFVFNPFEISFVGYSNAGKTTLIERLMPLMPVNTAYIKHDAHHFEMDRPGKDTDRIKKAGARAVHIANDEGFAFIGNVPMDKYDADRFLPFDCAIVEGYKKEAIAKILVLDEAAEILKNEEIIQNPPLAIVSRFGQVTIPWDLPFFHADDIESIYQFIMTHFKSRVPPLKALILSGGKSQRMGTDKASLRYGGRTSLERCVELAKAVVSDVFVSCREDQAQGLRSQFALLHDQFIGLGPLSGILSAMRFDPNASWLVLGIDLPFVDERALDQLRSRRNPLKYATSFKGYEDFPEPLVSIYEPKSFSRLLTGLGLGYDCPRKMLINSPIELLVPESSQWLQNVNDPKAYEEAIRDIGR